MGGREAAALHTRHRSIGPSPLLYCTVLYGGTGTAVISSDRNKKKQYTAVFISFECGGGSFDGSLDGVSVESGDDVNLLHLSPRASK